ncbi:MAG: hypothetical protein HYT40_01980 [Candidatus Sungbacteria bacterium]|uniref:Uncharacterized protein n=1 Tax=Candidatus Sungiibacteriota bacterium TaxID=2750080 RepID=A0A931SDI0_9BACT|nr:hypothetical protein [Candidatus Sungbacteria bacterium]
MEEIRKVTRAILPILEECFGVGEEVLEPLASGETLELSPECGKMTLVAELRQESRHYPTTVRAQVPNFLLLLSDAAAANGCVKEGIKFATRCYEATKGERPWPPVARFIVSALEKGRKAFKHKKPD